MTVPSPSQNEDSAQLNLGEVAVKQIGITPLPQSVVDNLDKDAVSSDLDLAQEFFIPIHGFVWLTKTEVELVNHPAFQRLGLFCQLGHSSLVYRGATHTRLEHSLGTLYVADEIVCAIGMNHHNVAMSGRRRGGIVLGRPISLRERIFIRLAALLHDVGHIPFGHTLEDELALLNKHDSLHRINLVLDKTTWFNSEVESLRMLVDRLYSPYIGDDKIRASDILVQLIAKQDSEHSSPAHNLIRINVYRDIVGNTICADLLDYLHRDLYHIGKQGHFEKRIFQYFEIWDDERQGESLFTVSLGESPKIRTDAISVILQLLESRYDLSESVLYHRTKCASAACLERAIMELYESIESSKRQEWVSDFEQRLLELSDSETISYLYKIANERNNVPGRNALSALAGRKIYKEVYTLFRDEGPSESQSEIRRLYSTDSDGDYQLEAPQRINRLRAVRLLEKDFGLKPGSIVMYCPGENMGFKIADVKVRIGGDIEKLSESERKGGSLSGGHLEAQHRRFMRLWRVHFFLHRNVYSALDRDKYLVLMTAIPRLVLGQTDRGLSMEEEAEKIARQLSELSDTPLSGRSIVELRKTSKGSPTRYYPSGAPSLSLFLETDDN